MKRNNTRDYIVITALALLGAGLLFYSMLFPPASAMAALPQHSLSMDNGPQVTPTCVPG